jgi:lysozyme
MNRALLEDDLKREESCRLLAYLDTEGVPTIGWGHTGPEVHLGLVWGQEMADQTLELDIDHVIDQLDQMLPWWRSLDDIRANVLAKMAYQMGIGGLLGFKQMLAHVKAGEWDLAKAAGLDSLWARQTPERADRELTELDTGVHA